MSRGPRPHRALEEAVPIAKVRGIVQLILIESERIFDIADHLSSPPPLSFLHVM